MRRAWLLLLPAHLHLPVAVAVAAAPNICLRIHLPRLTGEVRVGVGRERQNAGLRQYAAAPLAIEFDTPKCIPFDAFNAVVRRQPFVQRTSAYHR